MTRISLAIRAVPILLLSFVAAPASAQTVYYGVCEGTFAGFPLTGHFKVDYWPRSGTYSHTGVFEDRQGNRYDLEVISNQNGGVGSVWRNRERHRESRIEMRYSGNQFVIADLDNGGSGQFFCK